MTRAGGRTCNKINDEIVLTLAALPHHDSPFNYSNYRLLFDSLVEKYAKCLLHNDTIKCFLLSAFSRLRKKSDRPHKHQYLRNIQMSICCLNQYWVMSRNSIPLSHKLFTFWKSLIRWWRWVTHQVILFINRHKMAWLQTETIVEVSFYTSCSL